MISRKPLETPLAVRRAAMDLLARREHSRAELLRKLQPRVSARGLLDNELDQLEEDGLLSDARFCEAYVHARSQRGIGPQRLREELRLRGVGSALIEKVLQDAQWDWTALEAQVFAKRFPEGRASEPKERARQLRFMQYRGF